jgi:AcrR family transcriptional regulator
VTQERLLDIAIREFGAKGIEGASTRGIAAAAGTAMSSITYHYGSKEALYLAAADHIAASMAAEMTPALALCPVAVDCTAEEARAGIHAILERLATRMASDSSADWSLFILREQMNPSEAFDRIYNGMMGRVMTTLVDLIRIVRPSSLAEARTIAVTLCGQVLAIRASRAAILRLFAIETLDTHHADALRQTIHGNTDAILDRPSAKDHR